MPNLLVSFEGAVATITLNRPERRNALSQDLMLDLIAALDDCAHRSELRAVILAAEGQAFSSGHDLTEMRDRTEGDYRRIFDVCTELMRKVQSIPLPVIAQVQGIATAAGCQLVAACDLAVAVKEARFAVSGVNLGLFCSSPSVALARNVGRKAAFEMLVTGEFISADEARERGLVNRVVAADALDAEIESIVAAIVAKPRVAIALGKQLFYRQVETGTAAAYEDAGRTMACNMMEPATLEGVQAFIEKRKPDWPV